MFWIVLKKLMYVLTTKLMVKNLTTISFRNWKRHHPSLQVFKRLNTDITNLIDQNNLPKELLDYIRFLEAELEVPIKIVSVGPPGLQLLKGNFVIFIQSLRYLLMRTTLFTILIYVLLPLTINGQTKKISFSSKHSKGITQKNKKLINTLGKSNFLIIILS